MPRTIIDAQAALGFVLSQTSHIEREVNEAVYPAIQYPVLVPVDTSAHPMAKTVTYFSSDRFGAANWINGNSNDIPVVGNEQAKHETAVHMAAIGYQYGFEEIEHARAFGVNLSADDANAARQAYEEMVDRVMLNGDAAKGFQGLINNSTVTVASAVTGGWGSATDTQILGDINAALLISGTNTKFSFYADTLLMSFARMNLLATRRLGDTQLTILEFVRKNNTYTAMTGQPLMIRAVRGLETAGASSVQRMVAYRRNPAVLKAHIPMPHRFLAPVNTGPLTVTVPGVFRIGGLDIRRPLEVAYVDGI